MASMGKDRQREANSEVSVVGSMETRLFGPAPAKPVRCHQHHGYSCTLGSKRRRMRRVRYVIMATITAISN